MTAKPFKKNHVTVLGDPNARHSIIFVHGFGTDQTAWHTVAGAFLTGFRVILFDNVGAGQSDPAAFVQHHYLNLHPYATDLLDICQVLEIKNAILVGHSVGAIISVLAALKQPDYFCKLVLIGASPRYLNADDGYYGGLSAHDLNSIYSTIVNSFSSWSSAFAKTAMPHPDQSELAQHFAYAIKAIPQAHVLTVLCSIFQSDHRADVAKLTKPTLLIQTQEDAFVPLAVAEYLHQQIIGSRLSVINTIGHCPHISAPDEVIAAIRAFLAE